MEKIKITPEISALLKRLIQQFPLTFRPESQEPVPLAHGIHWQIDLSTLFWTHHQAAFRMRS